MRVWRVEHPSDRKGPFQSDVLYDGGLIVNYVVDGHKPVNGPLPSEDCGLPSIHGFKCAVAPRSEINRWFYPPHLAMLHDEGFVLGEYEVPDAECHVGSWQVAVPINAMKRIADHRLTP